MTALAISAFLLGVASLQATAPHCPGVDQTAGYRVASRIETATVDPAWLTAGLFGGPIVTAVLSFVRPAPPPRA